MSKKWTVDEINLLDSGLTSKEIAEAINRTITAVRVKKYYVNLSEQKRKEKQEYTLCKRHAGAFLESNRKANLKYYNPTKKCY